MAVVKKNGTYVATRAAINMVEGANVTITTTDDPTNNEVDITIASSGGGGGAVATDAIWDAAGDLAVGTGANTAAKLAIGTNGYVLTSNGTTAAWAASAGGASALDDLTDVTITSPATGATIVYNGADWVDGQLNLADSDAVTGTLPVGNGGTGITSLGTGVATFLGAPSSANLSAAVTDETGSGALVFATSPALVTPTGIVKGDVGLGNVDNTADTAKPVSTAQQTALDLKANLASPTFTGTVSAATITASGAVTGSNLSGTNTGDQTNITGNAATVTTNANLTGDVTSVGNATTLANSGVSANTYGSSSAVPVITVDAKGRATTITTAAIADSPAVLILTRSFFK